MNILWVKDNNIGHEKQVKNLLDEISKKIDLNIDERLVKGFFPFFTYLKNIEENQPGRIGLFVNVDFNSIDVENHIENR